MILDTSLYLALRAAPLHASAILPMRRTRSSMLAGSIPPESSNLVKLAERAGFEPAKRV